MNYLEIKETTIKNINIIRDDDTNVIILNYLTMFYLFSLIVSHKISGIIIYTIILVFFLNPNFKFYLKKSLRNKFVQFCLIYICVILVWMIGSENISYAIVQLKINKFYILPLFFMSFLKAEYINKFIFIFIFGLLINNIWKFLVLLDIIDTRYFNLLILQMDHSFLIFIAIFFSIYSLINNNNSLIQKLLFYFIIISSTINIFYLKKTAIVSYLLIIFISMLYIYKGNIIKLLSVFLLFVSFFLLSINYMFPNIKKQLTNEYIGVKQAIVKNEYTRSMSIRLGVNKFSIEAILSKPLFGYGTGSHTFAVINKLNKSKTEGLISTVSYNKIMATLTTGKHATLHNTFLQVLVQYGIIGFILYLGIFYQFAKYIFGEINIYSGIILVMLANVFLQFNTGWDFQFGNYGKLYIITAILLIVVKSDNINNNTTI